MAADPARGDGATAFALPLAAMIMFFRLQRRAGGESTGNRSEASENTMPGKYPDKIKRLPLYDGRFDAYRLGADDCDVLFASYPPGTSIPPHEHDTDNYGVITRGELILTMQGEVTRYAVGDWYHVPANTEHAAEFETETDEIEFWFRS